MLQLISITLIALAGFNFAAPTGNRNRVLSAKSVVSNTNMNWKRNNYQQASDFGMYSKLIDSAISEVLSRHSKMIKRQASQPFGTTPGGPLGALLGGAIGVPVGEPVEEPLTAPVGEPSTAPVGEPLTAPSDTPLAMPSDSTSNAPLTAPFNLPLTAPFDLPLTAPLELESTFRGLFDNLVGYIIQVTPLNDIVHGNYDFLYEIFTSKVKEALSSIGQGFPQFPTEGESPLDFLGGLGLSFPFEDVTKSVEHHDGNMKGGKEWDNEEDSEEEECKLCDDDEDSDDDEEDDSDEEDECDSDDEEE